MEDHLILAGILSILLSLFAVRKWASKGDVFHPGLIYCLINCGFFIVFAFGPYSYGFNLSFIYYYMYVIISAAFVLGIIRGDNNGRKKIVTDIKFNYLQLWVIYGLLLFLLISKLNNLTGGDLTNLASGVDNRTEQLEQAQVKLNIVGFIILVLQVSFIHLGSAITTAYAVFQKKSYWRIVLLAILITFNGIFTNSRTTFLIGLVPIFISAYSVLKDRGVIDFSQIKWSKNFKFTVPITVAILFIIGTLTNVRSAIVSAGYSAPYEHIEATTILHRRAWFNEFIKSQPVAIVNPIAELSIYAGSTVAHGGLVSQISIDSRLKTWGLRNFFSIHRIFSQLKLDGGISAFSVRNNESVLARASSSVNGIEYSWLGYPGNLIIDFGYFGSVIVSFVTGWMLGWIYGRVTNSGAILRATGYSIVLIAVILSPAFGPFGDLSNFTIFLVIIAYILKNSMSIKYLQY